MGVYSVKEWINISEIAEILGCSRPTVYKEIDTLDKDILHNLQKCEKNITYYNYTMIEKITNASNKIDDTVNKDQEELAADITNDNKTLNKDLYNTLISQLKIKDKQIDIKDKQIEDLSNRLNQKQDLHRNIQVLFKQQQPQDVKSLEVHFTEFDNQLIDIKENMKQREKNQEHKGIFSMIFKK